MTDLFGYLILASLIALVVGLVKPTAFSRWIKKPTRKKVGLIFGGLLFVFFIGFGMTTDTKSAPSKSTTQEQTKTDPTTPPQAPALSEQDQIKKLVTNFHLKGGADSPPFLHKKKPLTELNLL